MATSTAIPLEPATPERERSVPRPRRRRPGAATAMLAVYLLLALALLAGTWLAAEPSWAGVDADAPLFAWYLRWTPFAVTHLHSPLFTDYLHFPDGANLMWNTSIPLPALLMWPVTAVLGPLVAYNALATLALALSAWCAFLAIRRYTTRTVAAAVGGLLYGFSPYMLMQARGHLHLSIAVLPPLLLLIADEMLIRQRVSSRVLGAALGVLVAAQLLIGEELVAAGALVGAIGVGLLALLHPSEVRRRAPHAARVLGVAVLVAVVLSAYPLGVQFLGPQRVGGLLQPRDTFVADLRSFVVPNDVELLPVLGRFPALDSAPYVGIPMLLLLVVSPLLLRRHRVVVFATLLGLVVAVLSMGPRLHLGGRPTSIHLPWRVVGGLPLMENVLPIRLMVFTYLLIGVVVAVLLGHALGARARWWRGAGVLAVAMALLPLFPALPFPSTPARVPAFFTGAAVTRVPERSSLLVTPYYELRPMLWQAEAGMRYRTRQGGVFTPGPNFNAPSSPLSSELAALDGGLVAPPATLSEAQRAPYLEALAAGGVGTVVVGPSPGSAGLARFFEVLLGRPPEVTGGVAVWWDVHP